MKKIWLTFIIQKYDNLFQIRIVRNKRTSQTEKKNDYQSIV
jgi:hypothetical protein